MWKSAEYAAVLPAPEQALRGRATPLTITNKHYVNGRALLPPYPSEWVEVVFGLGCFWGAERRFWQVSGVQVTAVGYAGGYTPNPLYEEVCSGLTGHNEVVRVLYDPQQVSFAQLLTVFWESHDPTQGMQQGNDRGTQYRSGIYCSNAEQLMTAQESAADYQSALSAAGKNAITTELVLAPVFYFAEDYHQQYLAKNPGGYCGLGGTGICYPSSVGNI
ncbi:MAG: peptide-methionine (S)-S-oxide reductase MsrA [Gammaproteobacteria bacterium]|nr:peptide-methionine (S)-S-oxide reductase MsrA [Gammaproteobacteria bacterium]